MALDQLPVGFESAKSTPALPPTIWRNHRSRQEQAFHVLSEGEGKMNATLKGGRIWGKSTLASLELLATWRVADTAYETQQLRKFASDDFHYYHYHYQQLPKAAQLL